MLITRQPVFKRFWYPVMPLSQLTAEVPQSFVLLGEKLVLWLDSKGKPIAARDRCCHRSAQLSLGKVTAGNIACAYHGWEFDTTGNCIKVPQISDKAQIPKTYKIKTYQCQERYGYAWVCLADEPLKELPQIPEAGQSNYRLIPEFYETWNCAGLRVMENEMDLAHPTYVHTTTFGSMEHPIPDEMNVQDTDYGIKVKAKLGVVNPELQQQNLNMEEEQTYRTLDIDWFMPFTCLLRINYHNGLTHIVVNTATPINDSSSQIVQFCLRNDTEEQTKAADAVAFDRQVTLEDKVILESTDYDVPLDVKKEQHIMTDKPGILVRHKIATLLKEHGEIEQTY